MPIGYTKTFLHFFSQRIMNEWNKPSAKLVMYYLSTHLKVNYMNITET